MFTVTEIKKKKKDRIKDISNTVSKFECRPFPHYIKYMGSKTKILPFVVQGISKVYCGGGICDLFAGSCSLSGALGHLTTFYSNDIQTYSSFLANAYLNSWKDEKTFITGKEIIDKARVLVKEHSSELPSLISYEKCETLTKFNRIEKKNRELFEKDFSFNWHLFTKYYSGTWWSADQCLWIDAIREIAETQNSFPNYHVIITSLMYAMAYCSQGTGHYAQYRDAKTISSMEDISIYRQRKIEDYFLTKYEAVSNVLPTSKPNFNHSITSLDFEECLKKIPRCTIYADPPYCFVHYSRFYHALETLALYDYPEIQKENGKVVKGRYRTIRHQSPFCIRTKVRDAFSKLFLGVTMSESNLVLSYSNTGMVSLSELLELAKIGMVGYEIWVEELSHTHMTMGRKNDRDRNVSECLLLARRK